uniref:site-specific DNA-methyltransferase (adenine-specific) n=1 Tax=mine drainage metagenome TaxID=410659 RepID=E6Q7N5_9ZZZZ
MSARRRTEDATWLRLIEPEGQFLTPPVLRQAFPQGFDTLPNAIRDELHERYPATDDEGAWDAWLHWLLRSALGWGERFRTGEAATRYSLAIPEHGVEIHADAILEDPERGKARALLLRFPHGTPFEKRIAGERWNASPLDRAAQLCRARNVRIGMVTDGERIATLWVPAEGPGGHATWETTLFLESAEREVLRAFLSLFGAARFFGVAEKEQIEALFEESERKQSEVTDRLGYQVRQAVELLVGAISRANLERDGALLHETSPQEGYEAGVTVLMRLVFLLYAEERHLLPLDEPLYAEHYAASKLREQLDEQANAEGDAPLERRSAAWQRMLALFRAIYFGIAHDRLRLPAYGGRLFDPQRFAFLENLPVDDLTVRAILEAIQTIAEPGANARRRLSYRTLDVEQIGRVYEGLLDHGAERVDDIYVRLVGRSGDEAEIPLRDLERAAGEGEGTLVSFLVDTTNKSAGAVGKLIARGRNIANDPQMRRRLKTACGNDEQLTERIAPIVYCLDTDLHDLPTIFPAGSLVVKQTRARRDSGTEYTPSELAEEMVRYALEPLVYTPRLRPSAELLNLRICDPAVGSGAFLVAACRYLADRVVEAWIEEEPERMRADRDELTLDARRAVVDRCLYGVDRDAMAVEMAKLSLWLVTLGRERPFTFLDHAIRHGDSLLGLTSLDQVRYVHTNPESGRALYDGALFDATAVVTKLVDEAVRLREQLEALPSRTVRDADAKRRLNEEAEGVLARVNVIADAITVTALATAGQAEKKRNAAFLELGTRIRAALDPNVTELDRRAAIERLRSERQGRITFHWPLAFAEVFADSIERSRRATHGFDLVIGNPPFMGGKLITGNLGTDYRQYLVRELAGGRRGSADLVAYFFLRAAELGNQFAFLAVNTIAQGDTREVGLDALVEQGWRIARAVPSRPWPGAAGVHIAQLWLSKAAALPPPVSGVGDVRQAAQTVAGVGMLAPAVLDGVEVSTISPLLLAASRVKGNPFRLQANAGKAYQGSIILGMGFTMTPEEAAEVIERDPRNRDVLFPYLNADDLCSRPDASPSRWVISFFDRIEEEAAQYHDCYRIVDQLVRPERQRRNPDGTYKLRHPLPERWWQYADKRPALYGAIRRLEQVIVMPLVSKVVLPLMYPTRVVFSHRVEVIVSDSAAIFGLLTSNVHRSWARRHSSTLGTTTNYSPSDCFETFPSLSTDGSSVADVMEPLDSFRRDLMLSRNLGLTNLYNQVHNPKDRDDKIEALRRMHAELDRAVCDAYGWNDLDLAYGFHDTDEGTRWTIAPLVLIEILDRLLELNHQRHAEEVASGHVGPPARNGKSKGISAKEKTDSQQLSLTDSI